MVWCSEDELRARIEAAAPGTVGTKAASALASALDAAPSTEIALVDTFARFMEAIAETYFGQPWTDEHEFSVFARLTDDPRAWGYGGEEEIAPLRWLWENTGCWFDGKKLRHRDDWLRDFESWAEGQRALVAKMTPGAVQAAAPDGNSEPGGGMPAPGDGRGIRQAGDGDASPGDEGG